MHNDTAPAAPRGRYIHNYLAADLRVGDFVLMDRIAGYLKIVSLIGRTTPTPEIHGVDANGRSRTMVPTAPRVSAWVMHR